MRSSDDAWLAALEKMDRDLEKAERLGLLTPVSIAALRRQIARRRVPADEGQNDDTT